jgi:uncharacterized membrane protein
MADLPDGRPVNAASPSLQPVASGERIAVLDVLRGAALLGILLMNIEAFSGPLDLAFTGIDALAGHRLLGRRASTCSCRASSSPCSRCCSAPASR